MTSANEHNIDTMNGDLRKHMPTLKPPTEHIKSQFHKQLKVFIQLTLILLLAIPAIIVALYKKIFPPQGKSLKNKVALVTGSGRGLGRSIAIKLAKEGCKVACVDINEISVTDTANNIIREGCTAKSYVTNVASPEEVEKLAASVTKDLGPVDILVNNAGLVMGHGILEVENDELKSIISVNFLSHFWMIRSFLPSMKERNSGHIVAISSLSAFAGIAKLTTYASCKRALGGLMESVQEELRAVKGNEIKVTTVYPYFINTSEDYTTRWQIPLPELTIDEVVEPIVNGIKLDYRFVAIPNYLYYSMNFIRLLPGSIGDLVMDIANVRFKIPERQEWNNFPIYHILTDTLTKLLPGSIKDLVADVVNVSFTHIDRKDYHNFPVYSIIEDTKAK